MDAIKKLEKFLNLPCLRKHFTIKLSGSKWLKVDGFDPNTNTIYEFYRDYWHGNPKIYNQENINKAAHKTFGNLYENTINREEMLLKLGYNIVSIWENDFNTQIGNA